MNNSERLHHLEESLLKKYGPMLTGKELSKVLCYPSYDAFRQALVRGTVPVAIFSIEHRRGKFALASDIAAWLAEQRMNLVVNELKEDGAMP